MSSNVHSDVVHRPSEPPTQSPSAGRSTFACLFFFFQTCRGQRVVAAESIALCRIGGDLVASYAPRAQSVLSAALPTLSPLLLSPSVRPSLLPRRPTNGAHLSNPMMEISTAPQPVKGLADDGPWSPSTGTRPTVNTSSALSSNHLPSSTPSDQSPIPSSSLSPSSQPSPWIQPLNLSNPDQNNPFSFSPNARQGPPSPDLLSSGGQSPMFPSVNLSSNNGNGSNSDWANIFSAPLNPAVFAQLAANGIINPPNSVPPASATASTARFNSSHSQSRVHDGNRHRQSLPGVYPGQQPPVGPSSYSKRSSTGQQFPSSSSKSKSHSLGFTPMMSHGPASRGNTFVEGKSPTSGGHSRHTSSGTVPLLCFEKPSHADRYIGLT